MKPPAKTFVITIDDGWDDGYTYALPILQSHGFVATYFVIAGRIDRPGFLTSAHLQALVAAGDEIGDHTMDHERSGRAAGRETAVRDRCGRRPDRPGHRPTGPSPSPIRRASWTARPPPRSPPAGSCGSR